MHRHFAILSLPWLLQSSWQVAALSLPPEGLEVGLASRQHHHQDQPSSLAHDHSTHSNSSIPHSPSHDAHSSPHHSGPVLVNLNETAIEVHHGPQLPSYLTRDFNITVPKPLLPEHQGEWQALQAVVTAGEAKPWLMGIHVATMTLAFFGALPIGESMDVTGADFQRWLSVQRITPLTMPYTEHSSFYRHWAGLQGQLTKPVPLICMSGWLIVCMPADCQISGIRTLISRADPATALHYFSGA